MDQAQFDQISKAMVNFAEGIENTARFYNQEDALEARFVGFVNLNDRFLNPKQYSTHIPDRSEYFFPLIQVYGEDSSAKNSKPDEDIFMDFTTGVEYSDEQIQSGIDDGKEWEGIVRIQYFLQTDIET